MAAVRAVRAEAALGQAGTRGLLAQAELEDWAHVLQGYYNMSGDGPSGELIEALSDDLNTSNAVTVLRELYTKAKIGGSYELIKFAESCKFLGFMQLDKPGLFSTFIQGKNVESRALFDHATTVARLRAATANNAPQLLISELVSKIESENLKVQFEKGGRITIVGNDQAFTDKVVALIEARNMARKAKDFKEADRIRDELKSIGVVIKDSKENTTWEIVR